MCNEIKVQWKPLKIVSVTFLLFEKNDCKVFIEPGQIHTL